MISGTKCAICADKHHMHWLIHNIKARLTETVFTDTKDGAESEKT